MSIRKLKNPNTPLYNDLKKIILGNNFAWNYMKSNTWFDINASHKLIYDPENDNTFQKSSMHHHSFLLRSDLNNLYAKVNSPYMEDVNRMYCEIFNANRDVMKSFNMMCRCAANETQPYNGPDGKTRAHVDHDFPHKNMLIYLTNAGGNTFVEDEEFAPEEDDVIIFEGLHWHQLPKHKRRIVLVMTYI
tara:strand:- start:98 stop:664 length:567 start_codon:yes stop_codon:yes gene_type:complete